MSVVEVTTAYAFWHYDLYPYVLSGEIVAWDDKGYVQVKGYGGMRFKPVFVTSLEHGQRLAEKLAELKAEKGAAINAVHEEFRNRLNEFKKEEGVTL